MEYISCICKLRSLCQAINTLEDDLTRMYGLTLNEAMVMCCLGHDKLPARDIAQNTGIKVSHLSKVLRSIEDKGLLTREFGAEDKRLIYFSLTPEAIERLAALKKDGLPIPQLLTGFFADH